MVDDSEHFVTQLDSDLSSKLWTKHDFADDNFNVLLKKISEHIDEENHDHFLEDPLLFPNLLGHSLCLPKSFYLNHCSRSASLITPAENEHCCGGILADEMGMGKDDSLVTYSFE
jgi:SNF2 family DNA or RNA helicase